MGTIIYPDHIAMIYCACGHDGEALVQGIWGREAILRRAKCSACGQRRAVDVRIMSPGMHDPERGWWEMAEDGTLTRHEPGGAT